MHHCHQSLKQVLNSWLMAADFLPLPPYSSILYYFLLQVIKTITKFWNVIGGDVNEGARAAKTSSGAQFSPPHSSRGSFSLKKSTVNNVMFPLIKTFNRWLFCLSNFHS